MTPCVGSVVPSGTVTVIAMVTRVVFMFYIRTYVL